MANYDELLFGKNPINHAGAPAPAPLTPRQLAAQKAVATKQVKKQKRAEAAQKGVVTRKNNELKKSVQQGKHSADAVFNEYINDAAKGNRRYTDATR